MEVVGPREAAEADRAVADVVKPFSNPIMKTSLSKESSETTSTSFSGCWLLSAERARAGTLPVLIGLLCCFALHAVGNGKAFSTPQELISALGQAVKTANRAEFEVLFGPDSSWLANPDTVQAAENLDEFRAAFNLTNGLVKNSDRRMTLVVGTNAWPFPIPLVRTTQGWCFDTQAGREEILNRRIGRNELEVLEAMRMYVDAQREYASKGYGGHGALEYAQRIASSPGRTDGLYWPPELNGQMSPLGPFFADAQSEGYFKKEPSSGEEPQPFHGYFFKILKAQGKHAPGGKKEYVTKGHMTEGFGLVGWPAQYGETGVMTFIVNQQGRIYQTDLGPDTTKIASKMSAYDPDSSWQLTTD